MHLMVFGGAFDPLHNGHVDIVNYLLNVSTLDQLLIVPTGQPVHKSETFFPSQVRLDMLNQVFGHIDRVNILDVEIQKQQPSYTIDTIQFLKQQYSPESITLVVGFDQLYQFHRWRKYELILDRCQLLVILREGIDHQRLLNVFPEELAMFKDKIKIHEMYPTNTSSTQLRIMIKKKQAIDAYVPTEVAAIIKSFISF